MNVDEAHAQCHSAECPPAPACTKDPKCPEPNPNCPVHATCNGHSDCPMPNSHCRKHRYRCREWLLMLYMKVDAPNLEGPLDLDLDELLRPLKQATKHDRKKVYVILQVDYPSGISKRYWLRANGAVPLCAGPTGPGCRGPKKGPVEPLSPTISGCPPVPVDQQIPTDSPRSGHPVDDFGLDDFVRYARCHFPGHHTALVLWGHAVGVGEGLEALLPATGLSAGPVKSLLRMLMGLANFQSADAAAGANTNPLLRLAEAALDTIKIWMPAGVGSNLQTIKDIECPVDILGFDACFMAMVEVVFELRSVAKYILAPQAAIGLEGWHYDLLLDHILHDPTVTHPHHHTSHVLNLGKAAVRQVGLRRASPQSLSLLDTAQACRITRLMKALFHEIGRSLTCPQSEWGLRHTILATFDGALWAGARQFIDLADLCRQLAGRVPVPRVRDAATDVLSALSCGPGRLVVDQLTTVGLPLGGLSMYSPWPRATCRDLEEGVRNVEIDLFSYLRLEFVFESRYFTLFLHPNNFVAAERLWIRREVRDGVNSMASYIHRTLGAGGREPDVKPAGRQPDPKPSGKGDYGGYA